MRYCNSFSKDVLISFGVAKANCSAMKAFVLCLQRFVVLLEQRESCTVVAYPMSAGTLGGINYSEVNFVL
jgi:hypothetical protein